jgi:acyl carrier protein
MEEQIKKIMSAVFRVDESVINENSSSDTIESWDSLKHMNLIAALEEEFNIEFNEDDIVNMLNFKLIRLLVKEKITEK